jgi:hemerythrin-like metal-binding protein
MAFIEWHDSMSVGHPAIDDDHRRLIQYVNEMYSAMTAGKGQDILGGILAELVKDTQEHFEREEIVWKAGGYVDFDRHKQQHVDLLDMVGEFKAKYDQGTALLSLDVINFMRGWLTHHILNSDKAAAAAIARLQWKQNRYPTASKIARSIWC